MSWSTLNARTRSKLRAAVLHRDGYRCQIRLPGCTTVATTADHVAPRETGGDGLDNLRAACMGCNVRRGDPKKQDPPSRALGW